MIDERVSRYERALIYIAAAKPEGVPLTEADHERAVQVAAMVERYEAHVRAIVKPARAEPEQMAPRVARAPCTAAQASGPRGTACRGGTTPEAPG